MPRRGRSMGRSRSPSPSAPSRSFHAASQQRPASNLPARVPASPAPSLVQNQGRQPGMFAQMATTAAGVAVGSAVGHTLGAAMTGGRGGYGEAEPIGESSYYNEPVEQQGGVCGFEIRQFLECAQTQSDLSLCEGFNEAVRQCKLTNGLA
uniref:CHCH domain-containing protein n=1 Tax=Strigamia maritima TaxID=126957 RepID=T1IUS4_STRMM